MTPQELGKMVKKARTELKLTQSQLAEKLKLRRPTISTIETGKESKTSTVLKILRELGIKIKETL